jgi:hypothetical protein
MAMKELVFRIAAPRIVAAIVVLGGAMAVNAACATHTVFTYPGFNMYCTLVGVKDGNCIMQCVKVADNGTWS